MLKFQAMRKIDYTIRPMEDKDIPQVAEIDHEAFPNEWMFRSQTSYKEDLNNPVAHYMVACTKLTMVGVQQLSLFKRLFNPNRSSNEGECVTEYLVGFAGFWLMPKDAHITTIAVRSNYRQIGIGEALLISIIELAMRLNANLVTLEVRASNEIAQSLYEKYGFQVVGRRLRYYSDNGEDAILMNTDTITSASFQARFQQLKSAHAQRYLEIPMRLF